MSDKTFALIMAALTAVTVVAIVAAATLLLETF
jgi:hypothetical protein